MPLNPPKPLETKAEALDCVVKAKNVSKKKETSPKNPKKAKKKEVDLVE